MSISCFILLPDQSLCALAPVPMVVLFYIFFLTSAECSLATPLDDEHAMKQDLKNTQD